MSDSGQPEAPREPWQLVHREFVAALRALTLDEPRLQAAVAGSTVEQVVNGMLAQICTAHSLPLAEFFKSFEQDKTAQRQLEATMQLLLQSPTVMELRRPALLQDVRRELHLLAFALSGDEPPVEVWASMDVAEQQRVRGAAATMRGADPVLLERVRACLGRGEAFGTCQSCGKPIPVGRLQLVAAAERCAPCQGSLEAPPVADAPPLAAQVTFFHPRPSAPR